MINIISDLLNSFDELYERGDERRGGGGGRKGGGEGYIYIYLNTVSNRLGVLKCKYRKDDDEEYKIYKLEPVALSVLPELEKRTSDLELCGVCGNPDVILEDENDNDESWALNWVECEVCRQWFHQECLGLSIDTNDFICDSDNCVKKDNYSIAGKSKKRNISSGKSNGK